jgi:hypothetical protein
MSHPTSKGAKTTCHHLTLLDSLLFCLGGECLKRSAEASIGSAQLEHSLLDLVNLRLRQPLAVKKTLFFFQRKNIILSVVKLLICHRKVEQSSDIHKYRIRVSDPHLFNADPDTDPDPAFFLIADPGFDYLKLKKNL